jgi:hypothetical protein
VATPKGQRWPAGHPQMDLGVVFVENYFIKIEVSLNLFLFLFLLCT